MGKRFPLAILLSLLFAIVYMRLLAPTPEAEAGRPVAGPPASADAIPGTTPPGAQGTPPATPPSTPSGPPALTSGAEPEPEVPSLPVPFGGDDYTAEFETRGAGLVWLELHDYSPTAGVDSRLRLLGPVDDRFDSFLLRDFDGRYSLDTGNWTAVEDTDEQGRRQIVFQRVTPDGLVFTRTVTDTGEPFSFDLSIEVTNAGEDSEGTLSLILRGAHGVINTDYSSFASTPPTALLVIGNGEEDPTVVTWAKTKLRDGSPRRISEGETVIAVGAMTNYFTSVFVPRPGTWISQVLPVAVLDRTKIEAEVESVDAKTPLDEFQRERLRQQLEANDDYWNNASVDVVLSALRPAPGSSVRFDFLVYSGPKRIDLAHRPGYGFLTPIVEISYGSMAWINRSLMAIMLFFEGLTGNWGVAIILLTILVKGLLFPLNRVQQSSMARYSAIMQKLKPEIDALKEKYKNNKQKFNQEQMKLLKDHGATPPLGGCLLMLPQMFIWISLFQVLRSSIDLRHAPFAFWVHDLSGPDRMPFGFFGFATINLLPILMAASMAVQMRFTPQAAATSPEQQQTQKIMALLMPVMMLFFLYGYPSGLSLYIFTSSLIGIFEYRVIRKFWPPPTAATITLKPKTPKAAPKAKLRR